jgi:23S rRNA pseudouridine2604 synthase
MTQQDIKQTRLNKYISETGYCSRREADRLIEQGRVTINGSIPEMGTKVSPEDAVAVNGKPVKAKQQRIYIALNKPAGITCTTERHIQGNVIDHINYPTRIFPIGRLDKPSEGLIFLTNDGDIVNKILRAGNAHEKEYLVKVDRLVTDQFLTGMGRGVPILDTITKPCKLTRQGRHEFKIVLTQGLNQQIRRMCEHFGFEVTALTRTRIMNIDMQGLATGQWRLLTEQEILEINNMVQSSSKTEEASDYGQVKPKSKGQHSKRGVNSAARQKRYGFGDYAPELLEQDSSIQDAPIQDSLVQQAQPIYTHSNKESNDKRNSRFAEIAQREKAQQSTSLEAFTRPRMKGTLSLKKK